MNKTTIDMAREAGFPMAWISDNDGGVIRWKDIEAFAELVRADEREQSLQREKFIAERWAIECASQVEIEREACAMVCKKIAEGDPTDPNNDLAEYTVYGVAMQCVTAIEARRNT